MPNHPARKGIHLRMTFLKVARRTSGGSPRSDSLARLPSIAFVSGSRPTDGVFRLNFQLYEAVRDLAFSVRWIQCIDPSQSEGSYREGEIVRGLRLPSLSLEMGLNRLWTFPHRLRDVPQDRVVIGDPTFLGLARGTQASRSVAVVHDLRPLSRYGDRLSTRWMFRYVLPRLKRVRRIRVQSQFLRDQLEKVLGLRETVYVLPPHTSTPFEVGQEHAAIAERRISNAGEVSILYIATDRPYKNLRFFFDLAHALEGAVQPSFRFILVSRLLPSTTNELAGRHLTNLTVVPFASNLESIYRESDILAFPSLYEGFGLPMLEAMAHGIPTVVNDQEPMREVVGSGGVVLAVNDLKSWAEALHSLSVKAAYHQGSEKALLRAQDFSRTRFLEMTPTLVE